MVSQPLTGRDYGNSCWASLCGRPLTKPVRPGHKKGGGGRVRGESALMRRELCSAGQGLAEIVAEVPTSEFAAVVAGECRGLPGKLAADLREGHRPRWSSTPTRRSACGFPAPSGRWSGSVRLIRTIWERSGTEFGACP